jgi:hypothetical protein
LISLFSNSVFAPRKVNTAAFRSWEDSSSDAPVGRRLSRVTQRVETPSLSSLARMASAR